MIMSDLEEFGYVDQPHTSAGRIPTDKGYRFYVDSLMDRIPLSAAEVEWIEQQVTPNAVEVGDLLREARNLLAALSPYVVVALEPRLHETQFQRIEFVFMSRDRVLVILLADTGLVLHKTVRIEEPLTQDDLDRMARYLTDLLKGRTLREIRDLLVAQMAEEKAQYDRLLAQALRLGTKALEGEDESDIHVAGAARIADQPEFADVSRMKSLFSAFEDKSKLVMILNECLAADRCQIFIGSEIPVQDIQNLSVIAAPYRQGERTLGVLGVLGPTRMDYARALALVETTAKLLSRVLTERAA